MDFDYFTSVVRSDDETFLESVNYNPVQQNKTPSKLIPDTFHDERIKNVMRQEISSYEFKMLVIELLLGLVQSENVSQQIVDHHQLVCSQTLNFSLETLCSLQFGSAVNSAKLPQLKCCLSRLLLSSLEKVLVPPEMTQIALQKGVLPVMLRLAEDILRKNTVDKVKLIRDPDESGMTNEYIFGIVYGVITVVHCFLVQNSSGEKLDQFLTLFHQFGNSVNGRLIDKTVTLILSFSEVSVKKSLDRAKKIILLVSQLITALKRTRTKIVHARQCKRNRHRQCLSKAATQHHDNAFGCVYTATILASGTQQNCSVSSLFMTLTRFLTEDMDSDIVIQTLQLMTSCGMCCCFPPLVALKKIVKLIQSTDQRIRSCGLVLLERMFYKQMGAFEEFSCCELCAKNAQIENFEDLSKSSSSGAYASTKLSLEHMQSKWSCFGLFKDLLLSSDHRIAVLIGSHLLKIIPQCKLVVKKEILFTVFYPVFLKARERRSQTNLEIDKLLILTCLSVFTNLLRRVRMVEQFIEEKAMDHILELLQDKDTMKLCCSIIEIIIITKVWKIERSKYESDDLKRLFFSSIVNINEFNFLLEEICLNSEKCLTMVYEEGEEGLNTLSLTDRITCTNGSLVFDSLDCYNQYSQLLVSLTCLWKMLANLSLFSPLVRQSVQERTTTVLTLQLMMSILNRLSKTTLIKGKR